MNKYYIEFNYTDSDGEQRIFKAADIEAATRQQAFEKAWSQLSNSFFITYATENGERFY